MREVQLTKGLVTIVDDEDYDFLTQWSWYAHGIPGREYAARDTRHTTGKMTWMHCVVMERILGHPIPDEMEVDHVDRDRMNNTRANLRLATRNQNAANRHSRKRVGYRGVKRRKKRYQASIRPPGAPKEQYLGLFLTAKEAAMAYDRAALAFYGEFAILNFPEGGTP